MNSSAMPQRCRALRPVRVPARLLFLLALLACGAARGRAQAAVEPPPAAPRVTVLPVVGSAPETGMQYGATILRVFGLGPAETTRSSQQQAYVIYTAKSQVRAFLQQDRWSRGNDKRVRARAEYQRFPLPFFGMGDATLASDEEWYSSSGASFQLLAQRRIRGPHYAGAAIRWIEAKTGGFAPGGALASGAVPGSEGGRVVQAQAFVSRDSRDHVLSARNGHFVQLTASTATSAIGSAYDFGRYALDARRYWSLGPRRHVIAAQLLAEATSGTVPFDQMVLVGSDTALRGYTRGRYRDLNGASMQMEYRSPFVHRVGMVAFAGGGVIAPTLTSLRESRFLPTYGLGLRVLLVPAQRVTIRVDYGRGKGGGGLYIALNEAF